MKLTFFVVLIGLATLALAEPPAQIDSAIVPKFRGYFAVGHDVLFAMATTNNNGELKTDWLRLGSKIGAFTLESFDRKTDVLVLVAESRRLELALPGSRVRHQLNRLEALDHYASLIRSIEDRTKSYVTYAPMPPDDLEPLTGQVGEAILKKKTAIEGRGGSLLIARALDGLPIIFSQEPIDFTRMPKEWSSSLTPDDKKQTNDGLVKAKLHLGYVGYLAQVAAGNIKAFNPGLVPKKELKLPPEYIRSSSDGR